MIKNQKQASITRNKLAQLYKSRSVYETKKNEIHPIEFELGICSINGLIQDLENQIQIYESLIKGNFNSIEPRGIMDIPDALIGSRLAQKISQKELAEILGIKEQQVQRYEATDFESASFSRVVEFAHALNIQFSFKKIVIINTEDYEESFEYPTGYSKDDIVIAEEKVKKGRSLIFE
jgi:transcriptional regulator with XRE-family HTH domain